MKTLLSMLLCRSAFSCALSVAFVLAPRAAQAQATSFTYQGRLNDSATPANGLYDLSFAIFDAPSGGIQLGNSLTNSATVVSNGLFTLTLDFGAVFPGAGRWLEIAVRTNGSGAFVTLAPRQELTPSPYAITAENVVSGGLQAGVYGNAFTFNNPANSFAGDGGGLTNVNAATIAGIGPNGFWRTAGNAGTTAGANFLGTTDNQPLELQVNATRALRIEPHAADAPSLVGGYFQNSAAGFAGSVIAGGGSGALPNTASGNYTFIGSGRGNTNLANFSLIGSGENNLIGTGSDFSLINGGEFNFIQSTAQLATIGGGFDNRILTNGDMANISGGHDNTIESARFSIIGGGGYNMILADAYDSVIGGGGYNSIHTNSHSSAIGGGAGNMINTNAPYSTIGGGFANTVGTNAPWSAIGGGNGNTIQDNSPDATIAGGLNNQIETSAPTATIAGGHDNTIQAAPYSAIGGGGLNQILVGAYDAVIGGGGYNTVQSNSVGATIAGGDGNTVDTNSLYGTIGGGFLNSIETNASFSSIGGGAYNMIQTNATCAVVPGGSNNVAGGTFSFAAGQQAQALHQGSFVWADSQNAPFASTVNDQFNVRAQGGVRFVTGGAGLSVDGESTALLSQAQTFTGVNVFNNPLNSFTGDGISLSNVNAVAIGGLTVSNLWQLGGNSGNPNTVLGTLDESQPLNIVAANQRVLKLEKAVRFAFNSGIFSLGANLTGGSDYNAISSGVVGGTIAGGGSVDLVFFGIGPHPNIVSDDFGTIGGGSHNMVGNTNTDVTDVQAATVAGGANNMATASYAAVGGGNANQASGFGSVIGGGGYDGVVTFGNVASGASAVVAGGIQNNVFNNYGSVGGGAGNTNQGYASTIAGGWFNQVGGAYAAIGGGYANVATASYAAVAGGQGNNASGIYAAAGGGLNNQISGLEAAVPGGYGNLAAGQTSFAAGQQARALHQGAFVWADSQNGPFSSSASDQFDIRAQGGIQLSTNTSLFCGTQTRQMLNLWGTQYGIGVQNLTTYFRCDNASASTGFSWFRGGIHNDNQNNPGGGQELMRLTQSGLTVNGTFVSSSDRDSKEHFRPVSTRNVLEKVVGLPITTWTYKADPASRHIGPMAQDFYAAFGVGPDEKHITTVDEGGVALAAIQGLNQKVEEQQAEIELLKQQNGSLEKRLDELEALLKQAINRR